MTGERRKFNLSAWAAVGLASFLATIAGVQGYAVTKYKADLFEKQAVEYRVELVKFQEIYRGDQRRTDDKLSSLAQSVARIEQALDIPRN